MRKLTRLDLDFTFENADGLNVDGTITNATCDQLIKIVNVLNEVGKIVEDEENEVDIDVDADADAKKDELLEANDPTEAFSNDARIKFSDKAKIHWTDSNNKYLTD